MSVFPPVGPADYMRRYLRLLFWPDSDPTAHVSVGKYLQSDGGARARAALGAKDALLAQALSEIKWKNYANPPAEFMVGGWYYSKIVIVNVFTGKGTPDQIADVLRLAHRYGFIFNSTREPPRGLALSAQAYCDAYLGLDCNGFVGNYFGIDPNSSIGAYDMGLSRRSSVEDVRERDVLVWVKDKTDYPHIAVLDSAPLKGSGASTFAFRVAQSSGKDGLGLHESTYDVEIRTSAGGAFFVDPLRHANVYFLPPPSKAGSPAA